MSRSSERASAASEWASESCKQHVKFYKDQTKSMTINQIQWSSPISNALPVPCCDRFMADLWPTLWDSFFAVFRRLFFNALRWRFFYDFRPPTRPQNDSKIDVKSIKNRFKTTCDFHALFLHDFDRIFNQKRVSKQWKMIKIRLFL